MASPAHNGPKSHWTLNMGGEHGTPGVATPQNVVAVSGGNAYAEPEEVKAD
jgi:hypothetical protein